MKAPKFWQVDNFLAEVLLPFSVLYFIYMRLRKIFIKPKKVDAFIICVGNAVAGGAGKTPTAITLGKYLKSKKKKFAFVSKGYGGKTRKPKKVDAKKHDARDVGDEPILLSKAGTCWVGNSRNKTIKAAVKDGAKIIILDDGLQDLSIEKDLTLLVVDGTYGFGNNFIIPAGPLRDRADLVIQSSDAVIFVGDDKNQTLPFIKKFNSQIIKAKLSPLKTFNKREKYVAFAGIGNPKKFSDSLEKLRLKLVKAFEFPDHHFYSKGDIKFLKTQAEKLDAKLITTEKDAIKIPARDMENIEVFPIELTINNDEKLDKLFKDKI